MDWPEVSGHFEHDGSLRDIRIPGCSIQDWRRIWALLTTAPERLTFRIDGEETKALPASVEDAFRLRASHALAVSYRTGKQQFNCHFFNEETIEFDLDPRDVDGPAEGERLMQFIAMLGSVTAKEVRLTAENDPEDVIARYEPTTNVVTWVPAPS